MMGVECGTISFAVPRRLRRLVALSIVATLAACSGGAIPDRPDTKSTDETGDSPKVLSAADGSVVVDVSFAPAVGLPGTPLGFRPGADPVDVQVADGVIDEPVVLALPGVAPPARALPVVLHRNDAGVWESIPALFRNGFYVLEVMSFSVYWPGWVESAADWVSATSGEAVDAAGAVIDSGVDWLTGRTDAPKPCGRDPYPWVTSSGAPPDGAFHVCLDMNPTPDGTERVEVKVKSNRSVAMWIVVPREGLDYLWVEGSGWDWIRPVLTAFTGGGSERVLLAPGRTLTVGLLQPIGAGTVKEFFAYQDPVTQLFSILIRHVGELNGIVGTLLATIECFDTERPALSWERLSDCAGSALGMSQSALELKFEAAVKSGRLALAERDRVAFRTAVLRTEQISSTLARLRSFAATLIWANLATEAWVLTNDTALGNAANAGRLTIRLVSARDRSSSTSSSVVREVRRFVTPSGNIGCVILGGQARCDIRARIWQPPVRPANCDLDWGHAIELTGRGAQFVCAGDSAFVTEEVLPYGADALASGYRCESRESGVTCRNTATGKGFSLSREAYAIF